MVESRGTQGVKRKLSDGEGELRCYQRQTVFNISICKLQRSNSYVEPILCRTVLIANTVKLIEREMEEEKKFCGELKVSSFGNQQAVCRAEFAMTDRTSSVEVNVNPLCTPGEFNKLVDSQFELSMLEEKIAEELQIQTDKSNNCEDGQKPLNCEEKRKVEQTRVGHDSTYRHGFELDLLAASNLLGLDFNEEVAFSDVDVSLYDFDVGTSTFPIDIEGLCANAFNLCHNNSSSRCGESLKFEKGSETLFDDLDQVMQILVGS